MDEVAVRHKVPCHGTYASRHVESLLVAFERSFLKPIGKKQGNLTRATRQEAKQRAAHSTRQKQSQGLPLSRRLTNRQGQELGRAHATWQKQSQEFGLAHATQQKPRLGFAHVSLGKYEFYLPTFGIQGN
ncbi:unnamed protein product [Ilex paraguariensis]|uniref:Uncharacterized protein n=1 Tax=Ilex paraguariensis TaxID=185542 RepID=A0ABC8SG90_9AQUA